MTFLNPAILFGLLAASVPIFLHFLNLRKLKRIEFSTLTFLKELQKTKIKRIKFKQWLLLLLRILIIVFLVLAFARPAIKSSPFGASTAKTSAVFIIDNTFSMSVVSNEGSYFNKAKLYAKSLIESFQIGDEIAVIPISKTNEKKYNFISDLNFIVKEIDELQLSIKRATILQAILHAGEILFNSDNFNKELYIFTDLQSESLYNSKEELSNLNKLLSGVRTYLINVSDKEISNIGIDLLTVNNQIFEKNKNISFTASIKNYSRKPVNNSIASLFINGKRTAQQSFSLAPNETASLNFEAAVLDTGIITAWIDLEDDDIIFDNKRFTGFYVPSQLKVLLLYETKEDIPYISLALKNDYNKSIALKESAFSQASSINFNDYNAIIIVGVDQLSGLDKLKNYIENGGGVLIFPGSKSQINSLKLFLSGLGIPTQMSFVGEINSIENYLEFDKTDFQHAILADLFTDNQKIKIESPRVFYSLSMLNNANGKVLISLQNKKSFLSEHSLGSGKILLCNTAPILSWTDFPVKSLFAPLIQQSVFYLSSKNFEVENILVGEEILINLQKVKTKNLQVMLPENRNDYININPQTKQQYYSYMKSDYAGFYKFYSGPNIIDFAIANPDPRESISNNYSTSDFEDFLNQSNYDGDLITLEPGDNFLKSIYQSRIGSELWKIFILLTLFTAIIEMLLSKSSKKDLAELS
jgi:hypothetical protein